MWQRKICKAPIVGTNFPFTCDGLGLKKKTGTFWKTKTKKNNNNNNNNNNKIIIK